MNLMGCLLIFQEERPVFLREQANKMYNVTPYYLTKVAMEFPIQLVTPMLWWIITYFGVGLTLTAEKFFMAYCINFMLTFCASSLGYFLSSLFESEENAVSLSPVILMPLMLFSGFFSNSGSYPAWIGWVQYISPVKYGLEALIYNEFDDRVYGPDDVNLIDRLGFKLGIGACLGILAALIVVLRIISIVCLKLLVSKFQ